MIVLVPFDPTPLGLTVDEMKVAVTPASRQKLLERGKTAWRQRARDLHPDRLRPGDSDAPFKRLNQTWEELQEWVKDPPVYEKPKLPYWSPWQAPPWPTPAPRPHPPPPPKPPARPPIPIPPKGTCVQLHGLSHGKPEKKIPAAALPDRITVVVAPDKELGWSMSFREPLDALSNPIHMTLGSQQVWGTIVSRSYDQRGQLITCVVRPDSVR